MEKKILLMLSLIVVFGIFLLNFSSALNTGATNPQTAADDATVGSAVWINPNNAKVSDNTYAETQVGNYGGALDYSIRIVKANGSFGTTNKSTGALWNSDTEENVSFGGAADLWGENWTVADINDPDFGVAFSARITGFSSPTNDVLTHYLKATNFSFSIPAGSTIDGILAQIERYDTDRGSHEWDAFVDNIKLTVYYTEGVSDSCTPPAINNNWIVNFADNCILSSATDLGTGKIIASGAGSLTINTSLNAAGLELTCSDSSCKVIVNSGNKLSFK